MKTTILTLALLATAGMSGQMAAQEKHCDGHCGKGEECCKKQKVHTFEAGKGEFLLDGKPFVVKAAELHYTRIPQEYWRQRIQSVKALGMNAVCLYVFWNAHEPKEGEFNFEGQQDLAQFIDLCKQEGLYVILRPGPYVCAEWEMGGLPWWLLKDPNMQLRSLYPPYMEAVQKFENRVAKEVEPYMLKNGGNILMVQVENEFGSYGEDKPYVAAIRDGLRKAGWDGTQMMQCDWSTNFELNGLDDLLWTMNFGTWAKPVDEFKRLRELRPESPRMCSEYWSGWFDGWGCTHETRPADAMTNGIDAMLADSISFSLYMTHGGTSFGHWAGADNKGYYPDCTSYDYDAPINEQGSPTEKYWILRNVMQKYSDTALPPLPEAIPIAAIPEFTLTDFSPLLTSTAPGERIVEMEYPTTIESLDMGYGWVEYSTVLKSKVKEGSLMRLVSMHDYALIFADGKLIGELYRGSNGKNYIELPSLKKGTKLDIFVEPMGRINYSRLIHDRKGLKGVEIAKPVTDLSDAKFEALKDWKIRLIPVDYEVAAGRQFANAPKGSDGRGWYRGTFNAKAGKDTYLDLSNWGKGMVWINGRAIGRFWNVGPQQTLFLPGAWLKDGVNDILVMDITGPTQTTLAGLDSPNVTTTRREFMPAGGIEPPKEDADKNSKDNIGNDAAPGAK